MDKKEIDKLSAAYNNVPDKQIINELSWFNPYNSVTSAAKRWASGRGGFGSQLASKILPGSEERYGQSELEDETNEVWKQFRRQILSQDKTPKGSNILGWFKNTLGIDPKQISALGQNIVPNKRYDDHDTLRAIFRNALSQAKQFQMVGGAYDEKSAYATNPKLVLRSILDMDKDASIELANHLMSKMAGGGTVTVASMPRVASKDDVKDVIYDNILKLKGEGKLEEIGGMFGSADANPTTPAEDEIVFRASPEAQAEMKRRFLEETLPQIKKDIDLARGEHTDG